MSTSDLRTPPSHFEQTPKFKGAKSSGARCTTSKSLRFYGAGRIKPLIFIVLAGVGLPTLAHAQSAAFYDRGNNTSVLDRPKPDYSPSGIAVGAFTIDPTLNVTPEYDDNIYASHDDRTGDFITEIKPSVSASSNWSRNQIGGAASVVSNQYADHTSESTTDYTVSGFGRLDILANDDITGGVGYSHNTISRTGENTFNETSSPIQYDIVNFNLGSLQQLNRLRFNESLTFAHVTFDNVTDLAGGDLDLSFLNANNTTVSGRADYALNPEMSLYVSGSFNDRSYGSNTVQPDLDRSSNGTEFTVGTSFDITRLIRGQASVGYMEQHYDSTAYHNVSGPAVHVNIEYFLSGLTTLGLNINRSIVDAVDPVAVSFTQTQVGVTVDHELLRNVILSGRASYQTDDFTGEDRTDDRSSFSATATYLMNRNWSFIAGYSFLDENSSGLARIPNYYVNLVSFSIVLRL